ncbi:MAG: cobalt-precorrin-5B (C(1))-methyltransferase CbiD, partial [Faecalibacterium sp.]
AEALREVAEDYGYTGGFSVELSAPEGERLAKKTYNGRLGSVGGLSVLGTSGIVEPMSEDAIIQTIYIQIDVRYAAGDRFLLLTPGNYGQAFIRGTYPIPDDIPIKCSNFIGKAIDYAYQKGFEGIVVVGHAGKLLKLGCGLFQTHSKYGDCRAEVIATAAALYGASPDTIAAILAAVTSDEMLAAVQATGLQSPVLAKVMERIVYHLNGRVYGERKVAAVMFTDAVGIWGKTAQADEMLTYLAEKYARNAP